MLFNTITPVLHYVSLKTVSLFLQNPPCDDAKARRAGATALRTFNHPLYQIKQKESRVRR